MVIAANLGFPRMGAHRELKTAVEAFWAGKIKAEELQETAKKIRGLHWKLQKEAGLDHIPSNDFSFYDHVVDHSFAFGVIAARYKNLEPGLATYFAMCRGLQKSGVDVVACEMKKWFDTNYHYIVPEFEADQHFTLSNTKAVDEFKEAAGLGIHTRPVLLGPISYLLLGKPADGAPAGFEPISLLPKLLPVYEELLSKLAAAGADWIQLDEPFLSLDLAPGRKQDFATAYEALAKVSPKLKFLVATYFDRIDDKLEIIASIPIQALHVDLVRTPGQLDKILAHLPPGLILSIGVINGRNIWRADLAAATEIGKKAVEKIGAERLIIAPSCSLLQSPHSIEAEKGKIDEEILSWLAFAVEKVREVVIVAKVLAGKADGGIQADLEANRSAIASRKNSPRIRNEAVQKRLASVKPDQFQRKSKFPERQKKQQAKLGLPLFPTTTIGSFPQTAEVRAARAKFRKGELSEEKYMEFIFAETEKCIRKQEDIGLDVLVHGEFERTDMVEFFGENLEGYVHSANGWVQSYGSRCVKPPIIFGDISRPKPMTVDVIKKAQAMTKHPLKGMLTGPVTILQWSFVRDDQPHKDTAFQLALAIHDEVTDLEKAGIGVIQIDEPAIREGLPLRHADWAAYLAWAVDAFRLASSGVDDATQIHTHMCYSDFNDIIESIQRLDADVITIENSRSNLKLLHAFKKHAYVNEIGPGLYDIHSPRVPSKEELGERLTEILKYLPKGLLWLNPDCGLKTRAWPEVEAALKNLTAVAKEFREKSA